MNERSATRPAGSAATQAPSGPTLAGVPVADPKGARSIESPADAPPSEEPQRPLAVPATLVVRVLGWERRPVPGAEVTLRQNMVFDPQTPTGVTDENGRVRFTDIRWPDFVQDAEASGHAQPHGSEGRPSEPGESRVVSAQGVLGPDHLRRAGGADRLQQQIRARGALLHGSRA